MEMVSIEIIEEEILDLEKRDTSYAVCERLAWLYIVRDHLKSLLQTIRRQNSVLPTNLRDLSS